MTNNTANAVDAVSLGVVYMAQLRFDMAIHQFSTALIMDPHNPQAKEHLMGKAFQDAQ